MRLPKFDEYQTLMHGVPVELDGKVGELFWLNTKMTPFSGRILGLHVSYLNLAPYFLRRFFFPFKFYEGCETYALEIPEPPDFSLIDCIMRRRSPSTCIDSILPFSVLSGILHYSYGIIGTKEHKAKNEYGKDISIKQYYRPIPSAGGLYPLEIYVISLRIERLQPAIYHYNPFDSRLEKIFGPISLPAMEGRLERNLPGARPTIWLACFLITAIPRRQEIKYFSRAYRYILQESGHLAQNISLLATGYGYAILPIGGFLDDGFEELKLSFPDEFIVYPLLLGKPSEEEDNERIKKML